MGVQIAYVNTIQCVADAYTLTAFIRGSLCKPLLGKNLENIQDLYIQVMQRTAGTEEQPKD